VPVIVEEAEITKPHLLGYMHAFVSPFLHMKAGGMDKVPRFLHVKRPDTFWERVLRRSVVFSQRIQRGAVGQDRD
jgi:hypothetical protein